MNFFLNLNLIISLLLLNGCTTEEKNQSSEKGWKVTSYIENGTNKTSSFEGYTFDFQSTGVATATKGNEVVTGVWKEIIDSGRSKFVIEFSKSGVFEEISEDWTIVTKTNDLINLSHNSGNVVNSSGDSLQFEK